MRPGQGFGAICEPEQVSRMKRVIEHNEGELRASETRDDGVYLTICKVGPI